MAIQQYSFLILPKSTLNNETEDLNCQQDIDGFIDDEYYWLLKPIKSSFFNSIGSFLQENKSWSNNITLYGEEESNRFEILKNESNQVISVSFRIDFTSQYEEILKNIIEFCILNGFAIFDEKLNVLPLNFLEIKEVIESSQQYTKYNELSTND